VPNNLQPEVLKLVCRKCTRFAEFFGKNKFELIAQAIAGGWRKNGLQVTCPKCL